MSEQVKGGAMRTAKAKELFSIGSSMQRTGLQVAECHVPSRVNGNVVVPIVGTGDRKRYDQVPFGISILNDRETRESLVSLTPLEPDRLVGLHLYDPDPMTPGQINAEVGSRAGYAALHALVSIESGEDWSTVALFGEDPETGVMEPLPFEQGTPNSMTYMGILRAVAHNKLHDHMAAMPEHTKQDHSLVS